MSGFHICEVHNVSKVKAILKLPENGDELHRVIDGLSISAVQTALEICHHPQLHISLKFQHLHFRKGDVGGEKETRQFLNTD